MSERVVKRVESTARSVCSTHVELRTVQHQTKQKAKAMMGDQAFSMEMDGAPQETLQATITASVEMNGELQQICVPLEEWDILVDSVRTSLPRGPFD